MRSKIIVTGVLLAVLAILSVVCGSPGWWSDQADQPEEADPAAIDYVDDADKSVPSLDVSPIQTAAMASLETT
ncbi:MAG: hypothetical protein P9L99_21295 [Candidatus Lernaella stagnicola]|nr:hypothetical protein [Candidatus Lernaella stagnicola]